MSFYFNDKRRRLAFLDTRKSLEVKEVMEAATAEQVRARRILRNCFLTIKSKLIFMHTEKAFIFRAPETSCRYHGQRYGVG